MTGKEWFSWAGAAVICLLGNVVAGEDRIALMVQNPPITFFSELAEAVGDEQDLILEEQWVSYDNANLLVFFIENESELSLAILPPFVNDIWGTVESGPPGFLKYISGTVAEERRIDFAFFNVSRLPDGADLGCVSARQLVRQFVDIMDVQMIDIAKDCG